MKILLIAVAAWALLVASADAAEGVGRIPSVLGPSTKSCEKWAAERKSGGVVGWQYQQWLTGYVTAYNRWVEVGKDITSGMNAEGLFERIDVYCQQNPYASFANATDALIEHLRKQNKR
ncbi:MAG: hypothetical protein HQ503_07730 [Rhodospirillales bacterium]|nr:hypothetical protein [Rhodospirillales bacterium]